MSFVSSVALRDLAFIHASSTGPLFSGLSVHLPRGFTGVVGANGAGKTTLLRIVAGELAPSAGTVQGAHDAAYCEQRTDAPAGLVDLLDDFEPAAFEVRSRLGIEADYLARWATLSHGERKRAQIACALWRRPALLAIDEPTNHIDARARCLLVAALERFRGVGLIVSHDRTLLDALCVQCLWLEPPTARVYGGGYTQAREQRRLERAAAVAERSQAMREVRRLQAEVAERREHAAREHVDRSKRGLSRKDHDAREKIDRARVTDGKAGASLRQLHGRTEHARARLDAARVEKDYETGIWLPGSRSRRDFLFALEAGGVPLGGNRGAARATTRDAAEDRVAITGANGAGKSTLVRRILRDVNVPPEKVISMPQEIDAGEAVRLLDVARGLPSTELGHVMNVVSRLGSRPQRLLEPPSEPGEIRKLLLALGMARAPHFIVMDEPTNHLDLPSIEALEEALEECPCGLLLVSHDQRFLERLAKTWWHIDTDAPGGSVVTVR